VRAGPSVARLHPREIAILPIRVLMR